MKRLFDFTLIMLILSIGMCFMSCRSIKYVPIELKTDSIIVDRLIPVQLPADSSTIRALMECDENGRVILRWLDIANSKNAEAQLKIDSLGNLIAKMKTKTDTVYLPSKTIRVTKTVKEPYPVEKPLTKWQQFILRFGTPIIAIAGLYLVSKIISIIKRLLE